MDLTSISDLQVAMKLAGIKPNKNLGQHFLVDKASLNAIMEAADLGATDTVLEIGPGLGVMTGPLTRSVQQVIAVETDATLSAILRRGAAGNLEVEQADILQYDLNNLPKGYKVVANIPYYLTSKLIRTLMEAENPPALLSLLIQKEVAERIVATPGRTSILALSVQFYGDPSIAGIVERHNFWPSPEVDSAILRITRRPATRIQADPQRLFRLIKSGFGEKRKQLKNSLSGGLNSTPTVIVQLLEHAKIAPLARAQELDWPAWQRLYDAAAAAGLI